MAIISNGTTIASGGTVRGSAANLTNLPSSTPSNSDILSGVASASAGAVGSYAFLGADNENNMGGTAYAGDTRSGSYFRYINADGQFSGGPGGTWRCMGYSVQNSNTRIRTTTVWLRVS